MFMEAHEWAPMVKLMGLALVTFQNVCQQIHKWIPCTDHYRFVHMDMSLEWCNRSKKTYTEKKGFVTPTESFVKIEIKIFVTTTKCLVLSTKCLVLSTKCLVLSTKCLVLSTKRSVAAANFLVAATKILFVVPNFVAVPKPFFPWYNQYIVQ